MYYNIFFSHFQCSENKEKEKEGEGPRGPQQVEQAVIDEVITVFKDIPGLPGQFDKKKLSNLLLWIKGFDTNFETEE